MQVYKNNFLKGDAMATTRIEPVHPNKAWGVAQTIKRMTDYMKNPAKTDGGRLVTGFECDPDVVTEDFMFMRDEYRYRTGRDQGEKEVLAYHVRQSFLPDEIDADTASKLGYELALELTGGNHSFIVCTHIDKAHIHNHIVINSVNLDCDKKFRNEIGSYKRVQKIADRISKEHGLSVVENPELSEGTHNRYKTPTKRDGLAGLIDEVFAMHQPKDFDDFLKQLEKRGCEIKRRGKSVSVKPEGADRFFRLKSGKKGLPEGYDEESLRKKIADMQAKIPTDISTKGHDIYNEEIVTHLENYVHETPHTTSITMPATEDIQEDVSSVVDSKLPVKDVPMIEKTVATLADASTITSQKISHDKKINLIIDIENSIKAKDSPSYEQWAKGFNLQQAAETLLFLQTNNLTDMEALTQAATLAQTEYDGLQKRIDTASSRMKEVSTLQRYIGAYNKNRDIYSQYLRSKRDPKFRQENEKAIATVEEAKAFFDSLGAEKLPTIKELRAEYATLTQEKYNCQQAKNEKKQHVFDLQSAKKNAETLLGINSTHENERTKKRGLDSEL